MRFQPRVAGDSKLDVLVLAQFFGLVLDKALGGAVPLRFISFALVGGVGILVHLATLQAARAAGLGFVPAEACSDGGGDAGELLAQQRGDVSGRAAARAGAVAGSGAVRGGVRDRRGGEHRGGADAVLRAQAAGRRRRCWARPSAWCGTTRCRRRWCGGSGRVGRAPRSGHGRVVPCRKLPQAPTRALYDKCNDVAAAHVNRRGCNLSGTGAVRPPVLAGPGKFEASPGRPVCPGTTKQADSPERFAVQVRTRNEGPLEKVRTTARSLS